MNKADSLIRNSAKAIIIRDGCVLLIQINDDDGEWFVLPGGGQRHGETLPETVRRECLEETGVPVEVGELRLVREYIGKNHEAADRDSHVHRVEFIFECQLAGNAVPAKGALCDTHQTGMVWVPVTDLAAYTLYPTGLADILRDGVSSTGGAYMGDMA